MNPPMNPADLDFDLSQKQRRPPTSPKPSLAMTEKSEDSHRGGPLTLNWLGDKDHPASTAFVLVWLPSSSLLVEMGY